MLRAYCLPRVRFPGCGRFRPYAEQDAVLPFPHVVRSRQRSAVVSVERCGRHAQRDVHAGLGSGGIGRIREALGTSYLMLLFHIDDGMASGMVGSGLRMEGCADDSSVLPVEYGQEHTGHFAQDNAAAVCFSADDALRHNRCAACLCGHLPV